jgi:hypothetical protein
VSGLVKRFIAKGRQTKKKMDALSETVNRLRGEGKRTGEYRGIERELMYVGTDWHVDIYALSRLVHNYLVGIRNIGDRKA